MKKTLRTVILILAVSTLIGVLALCISSEDGEMTANIVYSDYIVYAGGQFDMNAGTNVDGATYQWYASYGRFGNPLPLDDNGAYSGTHTPHLSLKTRDDLKLGDEWENIFFSCLITAPDGRQKWTDNAFNMYVKSQESLRNDLTAEELEVSHLAVKGYAPSKEEDGVTYYDIPAGEQLSLELRWNPVPQEYRKSEVEGEISIWVTCDGKTKKLQSSGETFTPYRTGSGNVTVTAEYTVNLNGQYFMTLDRKMLVINTKTPAWETEAVTNTDVTILAERYNEAEKLARVSRGTEVLVVENGGTWCKIAAGGTVGYVPGYVLTVYDVIPSVDILIQEPCSDVPVNFNAEVTGKGYRLFSMDPVMWYDQTAERFLGPGDTFKNGHTCIVQVWLETDGNRRFRLSQGSYDSDMTGTLNGMAATVATAYEQDPARVVELRYVFRHVHDPQKITQQNPTCTQDGKLTYYLCWCGAEFEDNRALTRILDDDWGVIPARGHWESEWKTNGTEHYKICLRRECGEEIPGSRGAHTGGQAGCQAQALCDICGLGYGGYTDHVFSEYWDYSDAAGHAHRCTNPFCFEHTEIEAHVPGPAGVLCYYCGYELEQQPVQYPTGMSDWAEAEVLAAVDVGLVPQELQKNFQTPVKRGEITQLFVNLIEKITGKTAEQLVAEKGLSVNYGKFTDTSDMNVLLCNALGVINGTSDTKFSPEGTLKRAHVAALINRIAGLVGVDTSGYEHGFTDITGNYSWVGPELGWPVHAGIIKGTGGGKFSPGGDLTIEQTILIVYRAYLFLKQ